MEEDDYLSDKFLVEASTSAPKTYVDRRKEAQKQSRVKNDQGRIKSRRQRELESREEALNKSLIAKAKEDEEDGIGNANKALSIMMKMGYKPGEPLGRDQNEPGLAEKPHIPTDQQVDVEQSDCGRRRTEPLPIHEWDGKVGIGLRKRPPSPTSAERLAKMAKMEEQASHTTFRDRTRQEYEERRAEGRIHAAQRTCMTLDEKAGEPQLNILCLNPHDTNSFPDGLLDALNERSPVNLLADSNDTIESRLRRQMQADALLPLPSGIDDALAPSIAPVYSQETVDEASQFLRLSARDRLQLLISYLRQKRTYCFWCGVQYETGHEMDELCPGEDEESHD